VGRAVLCRPAEDIAQDQRGALLLREVLGRDEEGQLERFLRDDRVLRLRVGRTDLVEQPVGIVR